MKITQQQSDKLALAIQAVLGVAIIGMSVRNSVRMQTAQMKRMTNKDAKLLSKLQRQKYRQSAALSRQRAKLEKQRYLTQLKRLKTQRAALRK